MTSIVFSLVMIMLNGLLTCYGNRKATRLCTWRLSMAAQRWHVCCWGRVTSMWMYWRSTASHHYTLRPITDTTTSYDYYCNIARHHALPHRWICLLFNTT